jgi:ABC-type transporter Mla subunit MlaD
MLQTVLHDIQRALDAEQPHPHDTVERLETAAVSFETRHPELSALTRQLIAAIRGAGI